MLQTERLDFSAIAHRPKLTLPDGARLVVWVIVNVEEWDPAQPMPRTVLTPHLGYVTDDGYRIFYGDAVEDIAAFATGQPIRVIG